jgi:hypothetical protein
MARVKRNVPEVGRQGPNRPGAREVPGTIGGLLVALGPSRVALMSNRGRVVVSLALGLGLPACIAVNTGSDDGGGDASLSIDSLSVTPETVADGESFVVTWKVSHTNKTGYVTTMGLYVGTADELVDGQRDSRRLFDEAITAGVANGADNSSITCTRKGTIVKCGETNGGRDIAGVTDFTFRACSSYVLSSEDVCETRAVSLTFP